MHQSAIECPRPSATPEEVFEFYGGQAADLAADPGDADLYASQSYDRPDRKADPYLEKVQAELLQEPASAAVIQGYVDAPGALHVRGVDQIQTVRVAVGRHMGRGHELVGGALETALYRATMRPSEPPVFAFLGSEAEVICGSLQAAAERFRHLSDAERLSHDPAVHFDAMAAHMVRQAMSRVTELTTDIGHLTLAQAA